MPRILESVFLDGPAGRLETLHEGPGEDVEIVRAAVVCHPHPLHGGTMHNKVVFRMAKAAREAGCAVIRFNFRGVGQSAGTHDDGKGEQDDVRTALEYARSRYPDLPVALAGFSFGSSMSAKVASKDPAVERWVGAGLPVNRASFGFFADFRTPKFLVHSTHDEFGDCDRLEAVFASTPEPKSLEWIESPDHFFADALDEFQAAVERAFRAPV